MVRVPPLGHLEVRGGVPQHVGDDPEQLPLGRGIAGDGDAADEVPEQRDGVHGQPTSAAETTARASSCTRARCSGPWKDSA